MLKYFVVIWTEEKKILGIIWSCRKGGMIDILSFRGCPQFQSGEDVTIFPYLSAISLV
jgi:hypothetical protein